MQGKTDEALASSSSVARRVLLPNSIGPCRAQLEQREPGLRELACLDPVELHARLSASLAGAWVRPHQRKTEPRAIFSLTVNLVQHIGSTVLGSVRQPLDPSWIQNLAATEDAHETSFDGLTSRKGEFDSCASGACVHEASLSMS
jgi:hypothetical protein